MLRTRFRVIGIAVILLFLLATPSTLARRGAQPDAVPTAASAPTSTPDPTVVALNKAKLEQEAAKLRVDTDHANDWLWSNGVAFGSALISVLSALSVLWQFHRSARQAERNRADDARQAEDNRRKDLITAEAIRRKDRLNLESDRRVDRENTEQDLLAARAEERFKAAADGLGGVTEQGSFGAAVASAVTLRRFLAPGYDQEYVVQVFGLAVAFSRIQHQLDREPAASPRPPTALGRALAELLRKAYPLARAATATPGHDPELDAAATYLRRAPFQDADLAGIRLPDAMLGHADLTNANLTATNLDRSDLTSAMAAWVVLEHASLRGAILTGATLSGANLRRAGLAHAYLEGTKLVGADLRDARLARARLPGADLQRAQLQGASLFEAILTRTNLTKADLRGADLTLATLVEADLTGANPEAAALLTGAKLRRVVGLTAQQRDACRAKGAMFDDQMALPLDDPE